MRIFAAGAAIALVALAGCGVTTTSSATLDYAILPANIPSTQVLSPPEHAIGVVAYALGQNDTRGQPAQAALAVAGVDYLAGEFYHDPRFDTLPALDKVRMMQGRGEVRRALAIAPGATSQQVVVGLLLAAEAYRAGDPAGVAAALPVSVFTLGPDGTTRVLSNLPPLISANAAAQSANNYLLFGRTDV